MRGLYIILGLWSIANASIIGTLHSDAYSECYADRGLEQADLNAAGRFLEKNLAATPAGLAMVMNECVYKRHNTTVMSICNGSARNRTITQGEVQRGISQLFKDCNKLGTFTGVHVVNNLTFAAYGIFAGINIKPPGGKNPPDTPGSVRRGGKGSWLEFVGDSPLKVRADETDCPVSFLGQSRTDCPRPEGITLNEDGSCGPILPNKNSCQTFCEQKRTGLLGQETRAPGEAGLSQLPGQALALTKGKETSISQGFSAGLEGVLKEVFGAGVTYEWSYGSAKMESIERTAEPAADPEMWTRWVFFPRLIESCGTISRKKPELQIIGKGGSVPVCTGDVETLTDKCSISPYLVDGEASALWALRYEWQDGVIRPMDEQHPSYKAICNTPDPDGDGEDECTEGIPPASE